MSTAPSRFPLDPLLSVRQMRVRTLESELQRCRAEQARAETRRDQARSDWQRAGTERETYRIDTWRKLFEEGTPDALATSRYKRHLALLKQRIEQLHAVLEAREKALREAAEAVDVAAVAWRKAWRKLDAVEQMKQGWQRDENERAEQREELAMEELLVHRAPAI